MTKLAEIDEKNATKLIWILWNQGQELCGSQYFVVCVLLLPY